MAIATITMAARPSSRMSGVGLGPAAAEVDAAAGAAKTRVNGTAARRERMEGPSLTRLGESLA
jgi:hypothetical protein